MRSTLYGPKENSMPARACGAAKSGVDLLSITNSVLKTAHWKQQYEGGLHGKAGQEAHLYLPGVIPGGPHQEELPQPRRRGRTSALGAKRLKELLSEARQARRKCAQ